MPEHEWRGPGICFGRYRINRRYPKSAFLIVDEMTICRLTGKNIFCFFNLFAKDMNRVQPL